MAKIQYTLMNYFYSLECYDVETIEEAFEQLVKERDGDISNISEIYGNGNAINLEDYNHDIDAIREQLKLIELNSEEEIPYLNKLGEPYHD